MKKYSKEWWQGLRPEEAGKETERLVEKLFAEWNKKQAFAWHRMPDARAARGRLASQPSDYIYRSGEYAGLLEVKALKHPQRLPRARVSQLPTLLKWGMAGSNDVILIFHYMESKWRAVKPELLEIGPASWDLSGFQEFGNPEDALKSTGYFGE